MTAVSRRTILAATAAAAASPSVAAGPRPNILWLTSEDNNPYLGAYGDRLAHTPNIDALARKGVLYRNAYSPSPVCAPSRFALITGVHAESNAPAQHMRAVSKVPRNWRATPEYLRDAGYYCTNNEKTDYNCDIDPASAWHDSSSKAHWRARPDPAQPFFSVFNSMTTHESRLFRPTPGRVKPEEITVPEYLPDTPEIRSDYASYYNLMERMDGEIGARLAELEADGVADDTIVFYYSDNGGVLPRSKRYCYDEGLRVALVVCFPPKWAHLAPAEPGSEIETPVSLIDLPPTIIGLAGQPKPPQMQGRRLFPAGGPRRSPYVFGGRNRMDERVDFVRTVTDGRWRYIRNYMPVFPAVQVQAFAWLAAGYQSWERAHLEGRLSPAQDRFFQARPYEELYDLKTDPAEMRNLAPAPEARRQMAAFRRALDARMLEIRDNGFIPEGSPLEVRAAREAPGAYPLAKIMALAEAAARRRPADAVRFAALLNDPNDVVRYWAAFGVAMTPGGAVAQRSVLAEQLASERAPHVGVVLALALATTGEGAGVRRLAELTTDQSSMSVRLQALNSLTLLGASATPALPAIASAINAKDEYVSRAARYLQLKLSGRYDPSAKLAEGVAR